MDRPHFQNKEHKAYDIFMEKETNTLLTLLRIRLFGVKE